MTTSTVAGQVSEADGQPVAGAQVTVRNTSTGTERGTLTRSDGRYIISGLRPGGPYVMTITMLGFAEERIEGFELGLGQVRQIDVQLRTQAVALGEIRVSTANARNNSGVQTVVNEEAIARAPTLNREIVDVARLTPQAFVVNEDDDGAAISIAGQNNEYNSLYIDGVVNNDVFGLSAQGTNGGQTGAPPISFDAIEQLQIAVSPFDVTQGGFTGGAINAITRSGTNDFKGSLYYQLRNENLAGDSDWRGE
ncbi:MAG: carboxypeptidase regulatory-like domain-containing protein, partial [Gemmatimonadetes bacterium]|nr:carboxypeptidase regulatory-like domain-containing protein [Gemmatimonadota bacterium]